MTIDSYQAGIILTYFFNCETYVRFSCQDQRTTTQSVLFDITQSLFKDKPNYSYNFEAHWVLLGCARQHYYSSWIPLKQRNIVSCLEIVCFPLGQRYQPLILIKSFATYNQVRYMLVIFRFFSFQRYIFTQDEYDHYAYRFDNWLSQLLRLLTS